MLSVCIDHKPQGETAMGYFAGLDVSLEETAICIVDDIGKIVCEARVASEPEALVAFFGACGMRMERVGLEACSLTAWLYGGLTEAGLPAICIETRRAKAAMGAMPTRPIATTRAGSRRLCARAGIARFTSRARPVDPGVRC